VFGHDAFSPSLGDTGRAWLEGLNPQQQEAATHGSGPLLIVAGAGSGKTLTLACRVAHLIDQGNPPQRMLLLTFTRRAARMMLARAGQLVGQNVAGKVWGGTFHAVANRLLRLLGRPLGLRPDFTVMDQADAADMMDLIRGELDLGAGPRRFPTKATLAAIYSRTVNARTKLADVLEGDFPWCSEDIEAIGAIFRTYTGRKRDRNVLDYDDLLLYWHALAGAPRTGERLASLFDHILVDEYQDTNALQGEILRRMWRGSGSITAVGDDAQAIYSFRSATNRNILEFPRDFPGARILSLERNYRSIQPILDVSNAVIALAAKRHEKNLWTKRPSERKPVLVTCLDEAEQSDAVCSNLLEHREQGVALKEQAVLFRAAHHSDLLEIELTSRNIPFVKYGGPKFLESGHVKDMLALLRILENPSDEMSWFRILQVLDGVGPSGARRLIGDLHGQSPERAPSPLTAFLECVPTVPAAARKEAADLAAALAECAMNDLSLGSQIERLRRFLDPVLRRRYRAAESRLRDLGQLEQMASTYASRGQFIVDLTLDPPTSTADLAGPPALDEDYVILSTIHSAKGLEWDVVHVIHAADGMMPSDMATGSEEGVEEERRLLYVALTRARDALYVYFPLRYYRRRRGLEEPHTYAQLTRFIPESIHGLFDARMAGFEDDLRAAASAVSHVEEVDTFLTGLWGP
jgi:DNA helicase-2/ATP-dependent DNA helicase PcrA